VLGTLLVASHQRVLQFFHGMARWPLRWQRAVAQQQAHLELDPEQVRALGLEVEALIDRYRGLPTGPHTRRVRVELLAYPLGDPDGSGPGGRGVENGSGVEDGGTGE
jgi:hypothetical protein